MSLRTLTDDQNAILRQVEDGDFSLDDVSDHLNMIKSERNDKIENYLYVISELETGLAPVNMEIERLTKIKKSRVKALENIKNWLCMSMRDGEKHEFDLFKVTRVKGREVVNIIDIRLIPGEFLREETVEHVDKSALLRDFKVGAKISGAELIIGNPSLRIK